MSRLKNLNRIISVLLCGIMATAVFTFNASFAKPISAMSASELEQKKASNQTKIQELQEKLDGYSESQKQKKAYQKTLSDKMDKQQENIKITNEELKRINNDISDKEASISEMSDKIDNQEKSIKKGMDEFKLRIRAMYVSGNDSMASVLVGSEDFYDLLSKYELISQVSDYDNNLVNNLKDDLNEYAQNKKSLEQEKTELKVSKTEKESKRDEMQAELDSLSADYQNTSDQIESAKLEAQVTHSEIAELDKANEGLDGEIASIEASSEEMEASIAAAAAEDTTTVNIKVDTESGTAVVSQDTTETTEESDDSGKSIAGQTEGTTEVQDPTEETVTTTLAEETAEPTNAHSEEETKAVQTEAPQTAAPTEAPTTAAPTTEEATTEPKPATGGFVWPNTGSYAISSGFGQRWGTFHKGLDLAGGAGCAVVAAQSGTVIKVVSGCTHNYPKSSSCGCGGGYGNYVVISHGNGISTLYGHMASVSVSVGQKVSAGQQVGVVGSTGFSTGYHLHFEVRVNGSPVNPTSYLY